MSRLVPLASLRWQTIEFALAMLDASIDAIAARHGLSVESWEEEGLGPVRGVAGRLPSGCPVLLMELAYAPRREGSTGPDLNVGVDAADLATHGVQPLVDELLDVLELPASAVTWVQPSEVQQTAAHRAAWATAYAEARRRGEPLPEFPNDV